MKSYFREQVLPRRHAPDFHRPLATYLNAVIRAGCRIDEVAEPALDSNLAAEAPLEGAALALRPGYLVIAAVRDPLQS